ncbi:MAG: hypothetical protein NT018_09440 [Armatimonadetes bacterium]|nr:hypothetical protein [Armatimonadota bacterium]
MKNLLVIFLLLALVCGSIGACSAASSIYGISGLIETPDDSIADVASPQLTGFYAADLLDTGSNGTSFGGVLGVFPKLEVGAVAIGSDANGVDTQALLNAKYRLFSETLLAPSVTVGVVDMGKRLKEFNSQIDDASAFILIGKNLTSVAEGVSGRVIKPVRGAVGFGTGIYRGGFASLSVAVSPKFDLAVEYLSNGLSQDSTFNGMVRFNANNSCSISAGALDMKDFYAGLNYSVTRY